MKRTLIFSLFFTVAQAAVVRDWVQHDLTDEIVVHVEDVPFDVYEPCDLIIRQSGFPIDYVATGFGGDFVSLTCDARCKGPGATPALAWYKEPSQRPIPSTRRRLSSYSRSSSRVQRLFISFFLQRHVGVYTCRGWLGPIIGWVEKSITLQMGCAHPMISCDISRCLPAAYRCDGRKQCEDGFDEYGCGADSCHGSEFYCDDRCNDWVVRCDGNYDCYDGTDELNCEPDIQTTPPTLPPFDYDDENTTDSSQRTDCQGDLFLCPDGKCIPYSYVCDGMADCASEIDELDCGWPTTTLTYCEGDQFLCPDGRCIRTTFICDGMADCDSGIDELDCDWPTTPTFGPSTSSSTVELTSSPPTTAEYTIPTTVTTGSSTTTSSDCDTSVYFKCWNSKECIPSSWVCDGVEDCTDGDDELDCTGTTESSVNVTTGTPSVSTTPSVKSTEGTTTSVTSPKHSKTSGYTSSEAVTSNPTTSETAPKSSTTQPTTSKTIRHKTTDTSQFTTSKTAASSGATSITITETTKRALACPGKFNCGQGVCIHLNQRCDSIPNCDDERDEKNCQAASCSESQIACVDGKKCINANQWGDGECDCEDGSDEDNCG